MFERYVRQTALDDFGELGQTRLSKSTIAIIGAGGVASGAIPLLASCGLKKLKLADFDKVSISNLHRQTLYKENQVEKSKVLLAKKFCEELNSETEIEAFEGKIEVSKTSEEFLKDADIVIDACDNFSARASISEICKNLKKPVIMAAAQFYKSQITIFNDDFYFEDFVPDSSAKTEGSKGLPIFPASASFSGNLAASIAIQSIVKNEKLQGGKFIYFDHSLLKFFEAKL